MSLADHYQAQIQAGKIQDDPHQRQVLNLLQTIGDGVSRKHKPRLLKRKKAQRGLYLWGGVGVGKSFLVDLLFHHLPLQEKKRLHFHAFMLWVHERLTELEGMKNPLVKIAKRWAKDCKLLCLDELMVNDIGDAMICAELLNALYKEGVCVIFTSNFAPDELYRNGLARSRFLPAIELIKSHSDVVVLTGKHDYRTLAHQHRRHYFTPNDESANKILKECFEEITAGEKIFYDPMIICGRPVNIKARGGKAVWFDFSTLCSVPRSKKDYLYLAKHFDVLLLSDVNVIKPHQDDVVLTFMHCIDVFYDAKKQLFITAQAPPEKLYTEGRFLFQYQRTQSRLTELGY